METKSLADLSGTRNDDCKSESDVVCDSGFESCVSDSQLTNSEVIAKESQPNGSTLVTADVEVLNRNNELLLATDSSCSSSVRQATIESSEIPAVTENSNCLSSGIQTDNECLTLVSGSPISKRKQDGNNEIYDGPVSSVKKVRMTVDEDKPTVHVKYGSLTRKSKQKLEELLQQWSEWHTQHCSPTQDSKEILESGEGTYFPALRIGADNSSAVTFWMNKPSGDQHNREFVAVDCKTVPLYDRGYSLDGDSKNLDAFRCFNCGSYSHSLKECPKPRDNVAVNNARTQHQSNRNSKSSSSRIPTRYYQNSPGGKYDGLVPGVLQAETQQLLGLGEFDPPPWLHRMREIGYPPGYLDSEDDDDRPSGITIFTGEEKKEEKENNGKALETDCPKRPKKMSVQFPGINALIPKNADERKWAQLPSVNLSTTESFPSPNYLSQLSGISPYNNLSWHTDELAPPGCEPGLSSGPFSFSPIYASHDTGGYNFPSNLSGFPMRGNPIFQSSPLAYGGSPHSSSPLSPYLPQHGGLLSAVNDTFGYGRPYLPQHGGLFSPVNNGTFSYERL